MKALSHVRLFATPWTIQSWNSLGQKTGVGSLSLLQGIFPTQGLNWGLLHCRWILHQLSYQGSPLSQRPSQILVQVVHPLLPRPLCCFSWVCWLLHSLARVGMWSALWNSCDVPPRRTGLTALGTRIPRVPHAHPRSTVGPS